MTEDITTRPDSCRYCGQKALWKIGYTPIGNPRYRCVSCRRNFVAEPHYTGYSNALKQEVVLLKTTGLSNRAIARKLGINHQTVNAWLGSEAAAAQE
jgi:transposase-like protein